LNEKLTGQEERGKEKVAYKCESEFRMNPQYLCRNKDHQGIRY
jgi:hypothetical protein